MLKKISSNKKEALLGPNMQKLLLSQTLGICLVHRSTWTRVPFSTRPLTVFSCHASLGWQERKATNTWQLAKVLQSQPHQLSTAQLWGIKTEMKPGTLNPFASVLAHLQANAICVPDCQSLISQPAARSLLLLCASSAPLRLKGRASALMRAPGERHLILHPTAFPF